MRPPSTSPATDSPRPRARPATRCFTEATRRARRRRTEPTACAPGPVAGRLQFGAVEQSGHGGSPSLGAPDYWWYDVRRELLRVVMEPFLDSPALILDVGSADGPSV